MKRDDSSSTSPSGRRNAARRPNGPGLPKPGSMPPRRAWLLFIGILFANYLIMRTFFPGADAPITIPYTVFKQEVQKGNVKSIYSQGASIEGRFGEAVTWPPKDSKGEQRRPGAVLETPSRTAREFTTTLPAFVGPGLEQLLTDNKVEISAVPIQQGSLLGTLLYGFGPALLLIGFYV
ncbi:cell division protein FtsH, partial [Oxalobacteraceae bacterium OM1]